MNAQSARPWQARVTRQRLIEILGGWPLGSTVVMGGVKRGAKAPDKDRSSVPGSTSREPLPSRTTRQSRGRAGDLPARHRCARSVSQNAGARGEIMLRYQASRGKHTELPGADAPSACGTFRAEVR